eukprot:COSAG02_NODE_3264_length_7066_cov_91.385101_8_plen_108_part_00
MAHAMRGGRVCGSGGCWPTGLCVCFNRNLQNQMNELRRGAGRGALWAGSARIFCLANTASAVSQPAQLHLTGTGRSRDPCTSLAEPQTPRGRSEPTVCADSTSSGRQ